jgi:hypothetical protein
MQQQQLILFLSAAVLLAAATLEVRLGEQVVIPGLNFALPETCLSRQLLGLDCPGCGLTRSFICLAHGQFRRAWQFNPTGVILFGFVAAQIPYRLLQIWRVSSGREAIRYNRLTTWAVCAVAGGLCLQWVVRFALPESYP